MTSISAVLATVLVAAARPAVGWQFYVDGATDEAGPCHIDGCGYLREGGVGLDILPSGDVVIGGALRELGNEPGAGQAHHNVTSAGVARVSPAGLGSEVWRHSPIVVPPQYTQADSFFPQGMCHLGLVPMLKALPGGDVIAFVGPCKQFPAPASEVVVRLDGATGAVLWAYGPDYGTHPATLAVHGGTLFLPYIASGGRMVALDVATGAELWTKSLASLGLTGLGPAAVTSGGDVVVIGSSAGGPAVVRLAGANGQLLWTYTLTTTSNPEQNSLANVTVSPTDDIVVVGTIAGGDNGDFGVIKLSGGGGEQWRYATRGDGTIGGPLNVAYDAVIDGSGNVFAGGTLTVANRPVNPAGNGDAAIIKLSSGGAYQWTRTFDSGGNVLDERVAEGGLALDSAGNLVALLHLWSQRSFTNTRRDEVIAKLDGTSGNTLWQRRPMDTGALADDDEWVNVSQLRLDASDMVTAVGSIFRQRIVEYDYDAFVWRLYPNGSQTPCFDGIVDPGEACDDGNAVNGDGCDKNCTVSACGNGIAAGAEACDDGNAVEGDGCDSDCSVSACGNNITGGGEACDDGNVVEGDGCDSNCTVSACGNAIAAGAEACDDGNLVNGDACDTNCTVPACGNGIVAGGEACDDGNLVNGDGCESNCTVAGCGNGSVGGGETCDDGNQVSGDGCDANCVPTACGNGIVTAGETCDDGNLTSGDGCDANCRPTGCGSGIVTGGETCDDGNPLSGDGCDATCTPTGCGSGVVTAGEQCDDGNLTGGDGCEATCQFTVVTVAETVAPGGSVSTDTIGGATAAYPAQATVTTPTGGDVSIVKQANVAAPADGYSTLGMVIQIDAPPAASAAAPLQIALVVDASVVPAGISAATMEVFKDGVLVADCTGPSGQASPDPCVSDRQTLPSGDASLLVLTTTASAWALTAPTHDAVVRSLKPLVLRLLAAPATKALKVQVVNGDPKDATGEQTVQLTASTDCPGSTLSDPDFDADTPGAQSTVTLAAGKKGKAAVALTVNPAGVTGINGKAPVRCGVTLAAALVAPSAGVDDAEGNNVVTIDVDLYDDLDAGQVTGHETMLTALKPLKLKIGDGDASKSKLVKLSLVNADILPTPESGHQVTLTASDGTCPPGTVTQVDADATTDGIQGTVEVAGGGKAKASVNVSVSADAFASGGSKAPARCVALLTVTGPGGDVGARNDTARLLIDVFDQNDY